MTSIALYITVKIKIAKSTIAGMLSTRPMRLFSSSSVLFSSSFAANSPIKHKIATIAPIANCTATPVTVETAVDVVDMAVDVVDTAVDTAVDVVLIAVDSIFQYNP